MNIRPPMTSLIVMTIRLIVMNISLIVMYISLIVMYISLVYMTTRLVYCLYQHKFTLVHVDQCTSCHHMAP